MGKTSFRKPGDEQVCVSRYLGATEKLYIDIKDERFVYSGVPKNVYEDFLSMANLPEALPVTKAYETFIQGCYVSKPVTRRRRKTATIADGVESAREHHSTVRPTRIEDNIFCIDIARENAVIAPKQSEEASISDDTPGMKIIRKNMKEFDRRSKKLSRERSNKSKNRRR